MKSKNLILYNPGCYGTFVEWLLNFLENPNIDLPFKSNGSSHKFSGNLLAPPAKLHKDIESGKYFRYSRTHPGGTVGFGNHRLDPEKVNKEIIFFKQNFEKIAMINFDQDTVLWVENNIITKIVVSSEIFDQLLLVHGVPKKMNLETNTEDPVIRYKYSIESHMELDSPPITIDNLMGWNKPNIHDFEVWELRELLSFYWFDKCLSHSRDCESVKYNHKDILYINLIDFREDFFGVVDRLVDHFELEKPDSVTYQRLTQVHKQWASLQKHMYKDTVCQQIVDSLINGSFFEWKDYELSIIDEAWIQKSLRDRGLLIKCHGLVHFPTNTHDFSALIESA